MCICVHICKAHEVKPMLFIPRGIADLNNTSADGIPLGWQASFVSLPLADKSRNLELDLLGGA